MRAKVKMEPEQVEAWFDKEIQKLNNVHFKDIMKDFQQQMKLDEAGTQQIFLYKPSQKGVRTLIMESKGGWAEPIRDAAIIKLAIWNDGLKDLLR